MGDFEVQIDQLASAAGNARDAAAEIEGVDLAAAVDGIATAMPGSRSAATAPNLGTSWTGERDALGTALGDYADGLDTAAHLYRTNDEAAAEAFG